MALAHAILASLASCSGSGYDLAKHFDEKVNCFWKATQQQIYRELSRLEEQGWVSSEVVIQEGRPNKKLYSITQLGKQELTEWISQPSEPTQIREDLLVKIISGYLVSKSIIRQELERRRQVHLEKLSHFQDLEQQNFQNLQALAPELQFRYLTLRRGMRYEADWVAWCDEALELIEKLIKD